MRELKNLLILLITLGLLVLGANLPGLVAALQDSATAGSAGYSDIQPVSLDLSGERRYLSPVEKLRLLGQYNNIPITAGQAAMTEDDVYATVIAQMDRYAAAGIFEWFEMTSQMAQPFLCVDPQDPSRYNIFWTVTLVNEKEPFQSLIVDMDDETGTICAIRYDLYGTYDVNGVWERSYQVLDAVATVYLNGLGVLADRSETEVAPAFYEYLELDGEVLCGRLAFADDAGEEIRMEFYVNGTGGFYTYFPE